MSDHLSNFLYPRSCYYGPMQPENLVFNANLREFSQRVGFICALHTNGKLTRAEAYQEVKTLWNQLKHTKKQMEIDRQPFQERENSDSKDNLCILEEKCHDD